MNSIEAQIEERFPVWDALSEFFLDTNLQRDDYERIAKILAASRYTENELENILVDEVCPVCAANMFSLAGEWAGFDPGWLKAKAGQRLGRRPKFRSFFILWHKWMYARHWKKIKLKISQIRAKN